MQPLRSSLITLFILTAATRSMTQTGRLSWSPDPWKDPGWNLGHTRIVNGIVYSQNGKFVVSAGEDGSLRVWNAGNGALLKTMASDTAEVNALKLSPNDAFVASSGGAVCYTPSPVQATKLTRSPGRLWEPYWQAGISTDTSSSSIR
jgi:WD40 repeat protein